jgi:hypothetical protein
LLLALLALPEDPLEPPAPRAPGVIAVALSGAGLIAGAVVGGLSTPIVECICGPSQAANSGLRATSFTIAGSVLAMLGAMAWLVWTQPPDEARWRWPGITALVVGVVETVGGAVEELFTTSTGSGRRFDDLSCGMIIGSGVAALASGIAWLIWALR